jgi:aspartyl-tRNA(Asn)/glutamyl-tRNA(Gln) amidotransferase subunit B
VNISVRERGSKTLGTKVEIKNLNSMKVALKCIEYEFRRQSTAVSRGERIVQETRLWDEAAAETRAMRSKEFAHDYRYFPDPDLVEVHITPEWVEDVRAHLPELQDAKRRRFIADYGLPEYDARVLTVSKPLATYYEAAVTDHNNPKAISNWIMTEVLRELNSREIEADEFPVKPGHLASLVRMIDEGKISGKIAKDVFSRALESGRAPEEIVRTEGLLQVTDSGEVEKWVDEAIAENPDMVEKIRGGNTKTVQALVGQVMKKSRGKANPAIVNGLISTKLGLG